jgi:2-dehydro-3-deoxygluconokinase
LFTTRIYDINPVIDPMGVGDAFMAAFLHAYSHWGDDNQRCLDFSLAASALKNSVTGDFNLVTESEIESVMNDDCSHDDLRELQ